MNEVFKYATAYVHELEGIAKASIIEAKDEINAMSLAILQQTANSEQKSVKDWLANFSTSSKKHFQKMADQQMMISIDATLIL